MKKVLVMIPAYNEENSISSVINNIIKAVPGTDIVVVDDGSSDKTAEVAERSGANVISLLCNMGYGVALQTGYKYAHEHNFDYIFQIDGDGQHDPVYISDMLEVLENSDTDVVVGSRFLNDKNSYKASFLRRIGMNLFSGIASFIIKQKITDPTSGLQGFKKGVLPFLISTYFPIDYPDADVLIQLHRYGFRIKEISVKMSLNERKSMHHGLKPIYYVFKMFLSILVILLRKKGDI